MAILWKALCAAVVLCGLVRSASATSIEITAELYDDFDNLYAPIVLTFDAVGLPVPYLSGQQGIEFTNVNVSVTLSDGESFMETGGIGGINSYNPSGDALGFRFGNLIDAYFGVPIGWTGTGPVWGDDGESSLITFINGGEYYVIGTDAESRITSTPEPGSFVLLLTGLGAAGAWLGSRGRLVRTS